MTMLHQPKTARSRIGQRNRITVKGQVRCEDVRVTTGNTFSQRSSAARLRPASLSDVAPIAAFQTECWQEAYRDLVPREYLDPFLVGVLATPNTYPTAGFRRGTATQVPRDLGQPQLYRGWQYEDVSKDKVGWDISFTHRETPELAKVEVQGVSGSRPIVLLTANELKAARDHPEWILAVVTRALSDPTVVEYSVAQALDSAKPCVFKADLSDL